MPEGILQQVFDKETLQKLSKRAAISQEAAWIQMVLLVDSAPCDGTNLSLARLRRVKAAWQAYLTDAQNLGMFDGDAGTDLLARIRSTARHNFRSAMSECLAASVLMKRFQLQLEVRPGGRRKRVLEYEIIRDDGNIAVEVKAPERTIGDEIWSGDDSHSIQAALEKANRQFRKGVKNVLILVPYLRLPVFSFRGQLARALFGEPVFGFPVDPRTGDAVGEVVASGKPSGHFLKRRLPSGRAFKLNEMPRFTRVSGVLTIEEVAGQDSVEHRALFAINPHAQIPLEEDIFLDIPMLGIRGGALMWSDGHNLWL